MAVPAAALTVLALLAGLPADAQESAGTRPVPAPWAQAAATVQSTGPATVQAPTPSAYAGSDPATWGNRRLAAQLVFSCVDVGHLDRARRQAAAGIGGITLLGSDPPARLRARLRDVSAAARTPVLPFIASDEEGGTVQRLRQVIYRLPSARRWAPGGRPGSGVPPSATGSRCASSACGWTSRRSPTSPFAGSTSTTSAGRSRPTRSGSRWPTARGASACATPRVATVLKHWPGHGSATNSHTGPARVPPLDQLEGHDLLPFERELADGAPVVMVGHLLSRGLTTGKVPTSLSPRALRYLRRSAGPDVVVLTDSLAMAAASSSLGISPATATVRSLRAGADWAMACDASPLRAVTAVRRALDAGSLDRQQAEASARRILELKARWGLAPQAEATP